MDMQFCAQPNYASAFGFAQRQENNMHYPDTQLPIHPGFPGLQYMYGYHQPRTHLMVDRSGITDAKTESKPRLSKEEVEKLEKVFRENPKPSSSVKAQLADGLGLERPRINNWFQNRRAKAKQERKQEEYEARRVAEKEASDPDSPDDDDVSSRASEGFEDSSQRRAQPSSAAFPGIVSPYTHDTSPEIEAQDDEDDDEVTEDSEEARCFPQHGSIHKGDSTTGFQSPLSLDFTHINGNGFQANQTTDDYTTSQPMANYSSLVASDENSPGFSDDLASPLAQNNVGEHPSARYSDVSSTVFSNAAPLFFDSHTVDENSETYARSLEESGSQSIISADSFKSPPPPSNIASRRNIPRPAALQAASLRSRSYNLGGPKTAIDGTKRGDPSSPASSMRRIASASGSGPGRIQKSSIGPRSPMYFARKPEAFLQYHARSPAGPATATYTGAAPPTPMTPAVLDQFIREPTVSSACSDDGSFMVGSNVSSSILQELKAESNLKTPPSTPGLLTHFAANNFSAGHPYSASVDFTSDQPLLTPFFQTEFPDLSMRNVPSYLDMNDNSIPSTPMYPGMVGAVQEQGTFAGNMMGNANTQYDWGMNESVVSSKSSPDQSRSQQIQFTQNMTPQDYTAHEK
ncbi:hypothetical protein F5Y15DRAFT_280878 [Xylariaceae sp. FL0016]|nr:hypothetical protein F5Y15DRAFT_280878 [Xylariaceae sp. FL0016]